MKLQSQSVIERAHQGCVWCVAWSPSGELLGSCGSDCEVRIYALKEDGETLVPVVKTREKVFTRTIRSISWRADGRSIAAAGFDATASILSFKNDELAIVASLDLHESEVKSVSYSPSGALLATCSRDKVVYIWESGMDDDFECIAVLNGHKQDVKDVVWHPTAELLASASYDDSIRLWKEDYDEWYCCAKLSGHTSTVWSLSFDEKGDRLASVSADRQLIVWRQSSKEGKPLGSDPQWREVWKTDESEHKRPIYSVDWVGRLIATGSGDDCIRVFTETSTDMFELATCQPKSHRGDVNSVAWHPQKQGLLASAGDDGDIKIWKLEEDV
eukprot:CAMPEP_0113955998 /NCGR_PEP_ID=MMETSP0011_2-20120614/1774_1 /TAXON_ID=101924 /ORGANISM="Rhodosorus marinus" /LENGTH=328 /DNA_ID=CAMNT_0000966009 /DNA_START=198 /DNA_END=1184 /DNA_ORIENTATION=- /assembly_acc=CAM_ASM_000156